MTTLRRRAVYATNPRRRRRRGVRRYRRNPTMRGIVGQVVDLAQASGAALVGAAVGRTVSNLIPLNGSPLINFAKGAAVAIGIRTFGERIVGREMARFAAVGAMIGPTKDLIVSFVPQAQQFLGQPDQVMYLPSFPGGGMAAYGDVIQPGAVEYDTGSALGSYSSDFGGGI